MSYVSSYHVSSGTSFVQKKKENWAISNFTEGKYLQCCSMHFSRYTYTELFQLLTSRTAVLLLILHNIGIYPSVSTIQKLHKIRSHYWYFLQQNQYFSLQLYFLLFTFPLITADGLKDVSRGSCKVFPAQSALVAVDLYCPKHFTMFNLTHLMAQAKPPSLWSNLSNSQYISIWETTTSKGHTNLKRLCYGSGEREIKLFWNGERWRVIIIHFMS